LFGSHRHACQRGRKIGLTKRLRQARQVGGDPFYLGEAGNDQHWHWAPLPNGASQINARPSRHQMIGDEYVNAQPAIERTQGFVGRACLNHLVAELGKHIGGTHSNDVIVFDQQRGAERR
jgi:hypothetical protein